MFINIDDDYFSKFYENYENKNGKTDIYNQYKTDDYSEKHDYNNGILNPKDGLNIGNLFYDYYITYKNYKPRELIAQNEKEHLLLKIQELCFAQNDLNLYLDLYPKDQKAFQLFKEYTKEASRLSEVYAEKYGPLELNQDTGSEYLWYQDPWPWEVTK